MMNVIGDDDDGDDGLCGCVCVCMYVCMCGDIFDESLSLSVVVELFLSSH